jgi:hypothetical protein
MPFNCRFTDNSSTRIGVEWMIHCGNLPVTRGLEPSIGAAHRPDAAERRIHIAPQADAVLGMKAPSNL